MKLLAQLKLGSKKIKNVLYISIFCFSATLFSQSISINNTANSPEELVNLLINDSCIPKSNISVSSIESVAYFNNNSGAFPLTEGIIIRSGIAKQTEGTYSNTNLSSEINTNGDAELQAISNQNGQTSSITDVAFLEFDFIPVGNDFNFEFLFASNEYGQYQCQFSDVFAILLTNLDTGTTTNLAVLPASNDNISVQNIRDDQYNAGCSSINPNLFDTYNVNDPANSSLNMRGYTQILNAFSAVTPYVSYRIKFIIGDYNNSDFDSAVFIQAGSFDTNINIGEDQVICDGDEVIIDSGYTNTTDFNYQWQRNGIIIVGEMGPTLTADETGTYSITITGLNNSCVLSDAIIISDLQINSPNDILECDINGTGLFNLTFNNQTALGINADVYDLFYYNSLDNANNDTAIDASNLTNYEASGGETIYIKLRNKNTNNFCDALLEFQLLLTDVIAAVPNDFFVCQGTGPINISLEVETQILNGLIASAYTVNYFTTFADAENNSNPINATTFNFPTSVNSIAIWARLISNTNTTCFDIVSFEITQGDLPLLDDFQDVFECTSYTLPPLTNASYYLLPGGMGTALLAGDIITEQTTIYIYTIGADGCSNETNFVVYIADEFTIDLEHCGEFTLPSSIFGEFYTAANGPNGTGTLIPSGTSITVNTIIYFYSEIEGVFCFDTEYPILINELPLVDSFADVITCDSFFLPNTITNGNFFTANNGGGTPLNPGQEITGGQTVFIYNEDPITSCSNNSSFEVAIIDTSVFENIIACGSYTIPSLPFGNYYTENNGAGDLIPTGTIFTDTQSSIYYYAPEVTTMPNCTGIPVTININPIPLVDALDNIIGCENEVPIELPQLVNGDYYTQSGGGGAPLTEQERNNITTSQTFYIYNINTFCDAQTNFEVIINSVPLVDNLIDQTRCEFYDLPALINGQYFTETGGQGQELPAGTRIESTQNIYIYSEDPDINTCNNENNFTVTINGVQVQEPEDVVTCESYTLPALSVGNYFTETGGQGTQYNAGRTLTETATLYIYLESGDRSICTDEHIFTINIFNEPTLNTINTIEGCGSITLPTISIPNTIVEFYKSPAKIDLITPANYTISELGQQNIYVHAYPEGNPDCFSNQEFSIIVYPLLDLYIEGGIICINNETGTTTNPFVLASNLDPAEFTVNWYLEGDLMGTGPNYSATEEGVYDVQTIKLDLTIVSDCNYKPTQVVVTSSRPGFKIDFLTDDFVDFYSIQVSEVSAGLGSYIFALDNGAFQTSNRFANIIPGEYTITVRDLSGICDDIILNFIAIDYPLFFTPNNDGNNDTWNINDLKNDATATIKIYDRFGQMLSQIKPSGIGWDGSNNNASRMQQADYWFLLEYDINGERTLYKANFSLLRKNL